jgi:hypothetical protein
MADADVDSPGGPPLIKNWYRPWWKWGIAIVLMALGAPPNTTLLAPIPLLALVTAAALWVFVSTVVVRGAKRIRAGFAATREATTD